MTDMDLYTEAAAILEKIEKKQGSVKSLVFASSYKNVRQLYALVCESLKYQPVLLDILKGCNSLQKEETLYGQPHLATALLYEHLVGKGLGRAGKIRSCIVKHKREIQDVCTAMLEERGVMSLADLLSSQCQAFNKLPIPRYVRVNLVRTTVDDVIAAFTADGWAWQERLNLGSFQNAVESLGQERFARDPLLFDVLIFPPGTDLHDHPLTSAGDIVLQDRASCFPAHVLSPPCGATVLDCCAAPGNKTSHAASLMANSGKILAYERDGKRMTLLRQQLRKVGVTNTTPIHQDFLSVNPQDPQFADVRYIMVDPSCSGSGIMNRLDHINNNSNPTTSSQRLLSLQRFQITILKHALQFPAAQRVVYSTCSVYEEENEAVVAEVAEQVRGKFRVKTIFPELAHRGKGCSEISKSCLRMSPKKDLTNGFFVACFERVEGGGDGATEVESEKICEESAGEALMKRKNRKRKLSGGGGFDAGENGVDAGENGVSSLTSRPANAVSEQVEDGIDQSTESRTKRKKTKKSKMDTPNDQNGAARENGIVESCCLQGRAVESSSIENVMVKKCKKKKRERRVERCESGESGEGDQQLEPLTVDPACVADEAFKTPQKKKEGKDKAVTQCEGTVPGTEELKSVSTGSGFVMDEVPKKRKRKEKEVTLCENRALGSQRLRSLTANSVLVTNEVPKKKKKGKEKEATWGESTVPETEGRQSVTAGSNFVMDEVPKKKKKGKEKEATRGESTVPGTEGRQSVTAGSNFVTDEVPKKKKKKKKKTKTLSEATEHDSSMASQQTGTPEWTQPTTESSSVTDEISRHKKKKKTRRKCDQSQPDGTISTMAETAGGTRVGVLQLAG